MRERGIIVFKPSPDSAYGFIERELHPNEMTVFVHDKFFVDISEKCSVGMMVEYDLKESEKSPDKYDAKNVVVLGQRELTEQEKSRQQGRQLQRKSTSSKSQLKDNSVISKKNPFVVSITDMQIQTVRNEILDHLENQGTILILCLKGTSLGKAGGKKTQGQKLGRKKFALEKVQTTFPDYYASSFDWPGPEPLNPTRTTHPFISYMCDAAIILSPTESVIGKEKIYIDALTEQIHKKIFQDGKSRWTILGDETGQFAEFEGKAGSDGRISTMIWVAIPPDSSPPILPMRFHATGKIAHEDLAFRKLIDHPEILIFSFAFEEGKISSGSGRFGKDPHLSFWQESLPLVLEYIANITRSSTEVDIFVEQVKVLESGIGVLSPMILDLKTALNHRKGWSNLSFNEMWVLSKNPCEHPWIGYPDAIGHLFIDKSKRSEKSKEMLPTLRNRTIQVPFRQTSLNGPIRTALKDTARPLVFLKSLSDMSPEDIRDYIEPFFQGAISEALESLNPSEWQELLLHIDSTSKTKQGQEASNLIMRFVNLDATLQKLTNKRDQFDLLLAVLGTSNHVGRTDLANRCKVLIEIMREEGFKPPKSRLVKLKNLSGGANDNQFDFSHISDDWDIPEDAYEIEEEEARFLGSQAVSRALRGGEGDLQIAWKIEELLLDRTNNHSDLRRRYIYRSELLMDKGEFELAKQALEIELPQSISMSDNEQLLSDAYYLASLLKSCALTDAGIETYNRYQPYAIQSLNENHPSQRIAYWFARWSADIAQSETPHAKKCVQYLIDLKQETFFTKEAPGVILACELLDLHHRGLIQEQPQGFLDQVLDNSDSFAQEWVAAHPPNADDWLAPLNFNYR